MRTAGLLRAAVLGAAALPLACAAALAQETPDARAHHQLVHHPGEARTYLIGGSTPGEDGYRYFDDVWAWDGAEWIPDSPLPFPRSSHRVVHHVRRNSLILFGGGFGQAVRSEGVLWERGPGGWRAVGGHFRAGRSEPGLCYDRARDRIVVFGGWDVEGRYRGETWEWDGEELVQADSAGPEARAGHAFLFDPARETCLLFGGRGEGGYLGDTWEWDGGAWRRIDVAGPSPRWFFGAAEDPERGRIVVFGGAGPDGDLDDTWTWDGARWERADRERAARPPARGMPKLAWDGSGVLLFGGRQQGEEGFDDLSDTWRLEGGSWERRAVAAEPGSGDWVRADPESVGMDPAPLERMRADIRAGEWGNVHAVVVARRGRLVHESYFTGEDEHILGRYGSVAFGPDVRHGLRSVSKSFTATLVGIAIDQGRIPSVDAPLSRLLPEHAHLLTGEKAGLTLRHVLTMSAGLPWREGASVPDGEDDQGGLARSDDPLAFVLGREPERAPGEAFRYSGGLTQVLAGVLERATGEPLRAYADRMLFGPLGIEDWEWITLGSADPSAYSGLRLRATDMAKLGQVHLDGGRWNGRQVVSSGWVRQALEPFVPTPSPRAPPFVESTGYGFQWWLDTHRWEGRTLSYRSAWGNGGQRILVIPEMELVVAVFAGFYQDPSSSWIPDTIVREYVLAAVREEGGARR